MRTHTPGRILLRIRSGRFFCDRKLHFLSQKKMAIRTRAGPRNCRGIPGKKEKEGTALTETKTRIAVIGIIIEDRRQAEKVNALLHQYGSYVIGRMGLPYEKKQVNIISVVLDAPMDAISALSGKLGRLPGVSARAIYSKAVQDAERAQRPKGNPPAQGGQEG